MPDHCPGPPDAVSAHEPGPADSGNASPAAGRSTRTPILLTHQQRGVQKTLHSMLRRWRRRFRALGDRFQEPLQFSHDLHHRLRLRQFPGQPRILRDQPIHILRRSDHFPRTMMRFPRRCQTPSLRIPGIGPFSDLRLIQTLPPQHSGLLPVWCRRVLRDHPGPVVGRERPADRPRRRIHRPNIRVRTSSRLRRLDAATHRSGSLSRPTRCTRTYRMSHLSLTRRVSIRSLGPGR